MDIKQLRTLLAFAKDESYNKASQSLNYSVSTLVAHISALEDELHVELVNSKGRRSFLTDKGKAFLPYARRMVDLYDEAYAAMNVSREVTGNMQLVTSETVARQMSRVYKNFTSENPDVNLTVRIGSLAAAQQQLLDKTTDLIVYQDFAPPASSYITAVPLYRMPLQLIGSPKHRLAAKKAIYPEDLKGESFLFPRRQYIEQPIIRDVLKEAGANIGENLFMDSGDLVRGEIAKGLTLSFMPWSDEDKHVKEGSIIQLPWKGEEIFMTVYAMYETNTLLLASIEAFMEYCKKLMGR
ncbi:MAG: LysR family transcriptional regulator [Firmicutes bacterium]|nr:LysR family transcriptional regulator [Lachnospiraceae bacterium]MBO4880942.1 LysR family transcriptional regulator [Bacillota bacterium]